MPFDCMKCVKSWEHFKNCLNVLCSKDKLDNNVHCTCMCLCSCLVDTVHLKGSKFVMSVKIKATVD